MNKNHYYRYAIVSALCLLTLQAHAQKKEVFKVLTSKQGFAAGAVKEVQVNLKNVSIPKGYVGTSAAQFTNNSGLLLNPTGSKHSIVPSEFTILGSEKVVRPEQIIQPIDVTVQHMTPAERAIWRGVREKFVSTAYYQPLAPGQVASYLRHPVPPQTLEHLQTQYANVVTTIHEVQKKIMPTIVYASLPGEGSRPTPLEIGKASEAIYPIINRIRELRTALEDDIYLEKQLEAWEHAFAAFNPLLASIIISPTKAIGRKDERVLNSREFNLYNPDGTDYLLPRSETLLVDPDELDEMDSYAAVREKMRNPPIKAEDAEKERAALLEQIPSGLRIALINDDMLPRVNFAGWGKKGYLGRDAKIEVFSDGQGFMEQIRNGARYDLVITDLLVPYGGIAMMPELRARDERAAVIASSKFDRGEEDEEKLFNLGFDGYLWYNTNLNEGAYGYIEYLRAMKNYFHYKQKYNWQR